MSAREAGRDREYSPGRWRPVQIVFAGKAHPQDKDGQGYAAQVHRWASESGFEGRIVEREQLPASERFKGSHRERG